jgi:hypothetical protein
MTDYSQYISDNTIICGGHFLLSSQGPLLNEGTIHSFKLAVDTFRAAKRRYRNVRAGLLINDIGTVCSASSCSITKPMSKENFELPQAYKDILAGEELTIFWEKHMRNRGKKQLAKELSKNNPHVAAEDGGYVFKKDGVSLLMTRSIPGDIHGTPACPLIMAALALEQEKMKFQSCFNFYYVGDDNFDNIANHFVIEKGKHLGHLLGAKIDVKNIYLFKERVLKNFA